METRASYVLVGSFVLLIIVAIFGFIIWIAKGQFERKVDHYQTFFSTTVTGLQAGSVVRYRGIPVGEVTDISWSKVDKNLIEVTFEVKHGTPIDQFSIAVLETQGITGVAFIQIKHDAEKLAKWRSEHKDPTIEPGPPLVAKAFGATYPTLEAEGSGFEKILTALPEMLKSIRELADAAKTLFSKKNQESIETTLANVAILTKKLGSKSTQIDRIIDNLDKTTSSLGPAVNDIRTSMRQFGDASKSLDKLVRETQRPLRDFAATGLYDLSLFITEARELVRNLNRVSKNFEDDPSRFLFGNAQKGVEVK
jgi:phospholipid/cholesterol/gamma-HCH transport system substrate-binding protein